MRKQDKKSRIHSQKALSVIEEIQGKYPNKISDIKIMNDEARAWIQLKIQQFRECCKKMLFSQKPVWWESMRITRNKTAHQTENLSNEVFLSITSTLFSNISRIESDLKENINRYRQTSKKKRKFENFTSPEFGSEIEKKKIVDALEDSFNSIEPDDLKIEFPKNKYSKIAEKTVSEIISHQNNKDYISKHYELSENVQTDILEWLENTYSTLEKENPFRDEAIFIEEKKRLSLLEIAEDFTNENSKIEYHYKRLSSVSEAKRGDIEKSSLDFNFYKQKFLEEKEIKTIKNEKGEDEKKIIWKSQENLETLKRNLICDMEKNFVDRKNKWELKRIDELRKEFLEKLYSKIENFIKLENLISPFIKNYGRLWDLSEGIFETSGFEILETFANLLEQDESLQELSDLLGKQNRAQSLFEKELRDKVVLKSNWQPVRAYRGEIEGLKYSNDISATLPNELALIGNPALNKLFQLKFAQKQLLSYDYKTDEEFIFEEKESAEIGVEKKEPKGSIIICVDTSGSMNGTPENIAKTVTFALSKIAIEEERKCYLISFSTGIQTLDLSDFSNQPINKLVQFLRMSFNGGTDAEPALRHALEMLTNNQWKNADVLMISDFVMESLKTDLAEKIELEKKKDTVFYSLTIGNSGNKGAIDCFNHNWFYDMNSPKASRHLVEQLHEIKNRGN